ncbi:hypothetical protein [Fulvivirga sediminis]|uniref:Lipocalin-like domain-containing protein n=1 Tax=Fulvivirga sediminis TaxID=2803949 RepID=A0A937FCS9_9BACT|nr:hypothetical protein [Fulvivirga sediminis]MBL3658829.1 hypothetical protein [Fulvivirga sediminis]
MKILKLLFASSLIASSVFFASCSDDDESPSYEKSEFIGEWELTASTNSDYEECDNITRTLTISESTLSVPGYNCTTAKAILEYTFSGKSFDFNAFGVDASYVVKSKSDTQFTWEFDGDVDTYTKID